MIPLFRLLIFTSPPFPRIRGGDPIGVTTTQRMIELFPAYAGVIPYTIGRFEYEEAFPRIRGGDPNLKKRWMGYSPFSPHTRG